MNHYLLTPSGVTTIEEGQEHFIDSMARRRIFRKQLVIREDGTTLREPPRPKHSKNHPSVRGSTAVLDQPAPYDWENDDDLYANGPDYPLKTMLLDIGLIVVVACIVIYALLTAY